jgi:hypothetical protein
MSLEDDVDIKFIKGGDTRKNTIRPDDVASQEEQLAIVRPQTTATQYRVATEPDEASWVGLGSL